MLNFNYELEHKNYIISDSSYQTKMDRRQILVLLKKNEFQRVSMEACTKR